MAIATGTPSSMRMRKPPSSSSMSLSFKTVVGTGTFEDRIALSPVLHRHLHGAQEHQHEAQKNGVADIILAKIDRGHLFVADDLDVDPAQLDRITEEGNADQVDRR